MKILILGGSGMLGHKLWQVLGEQFESFCTLRTTKPNPKLQQLETYKRKIVYNVDAYETGSVEKAIDAVKPDIVINCIGLIKQLDISNSYEPTIQLNSLFPHQVNTYCKKRLIKFIHISTDCVFSGKTGNYSETDFADANDLYGRSKYLGEVTYDNALTLRTSIVGHELEASISLIDWFLSQKEMVKGYSNVMYSGLTTLELSNVILNIVSNHPDLEGLYQVASNPISKNHLLQLVKTTYKHDVSINAFDGYKSNKVLLPTKFITQIGYTAPSWNKMLNSLFEDYTMNNFLYQK